jgi:hypothetical protein
MYSLKGAGRFVKSVRLLPVAVTRHTSRLTGDPSCPVKAMKLLPGDQYGRIAVQFDVGETISLNCAPVALIVAMPRVEVANAILFPSGDQ